MLYQIQEKYKVIKPPKHIDAHLTIIKGDDEVKKLLNYVKKSESVGVYLNIWFDEASILETLKIELPKDNKFKGKKVLVEHTSANPTKSLHIGHIRNAVIGDVLYKFLKLLGAKVHASNYVDDTGLQVAELIYGIKNLGHIKESDFEYFDEYCDKVYTEINKIIKEQPELMHKIKDILKELENPNSETYIFAKEITDKVLVDQLKTLEDLGIVFDYMISESSIIENELWENAIKILKEKGIIFYCEEGEKAGCWVYDMKKVDPNLDDLKVIIRSNGTATYVGKDIAFAMWKHGILENNFKFRELYNTYITDKDGKEIEEYYNYDISFQVIGEEQKLPQSIVKSIISELSDKEYNHYAYGLVALSKNTARMLGIECDGILHMSGRKGIFVRCRDLYNKIFEILGDLDSEVKHKLVKNIIRYEMIKQNVTKLLVFDIEESVKLEGNTGMYVSYTYARAKSVLEKCSDEKFEEIHELNKFELELFKTILEFYLVMYGVSKDLKLNDITTYLFNLCNTFNSFYQNCKICGSNSKIRYLLLLRTVEILELLFDILGLEKINKI
jgi:arginyl-tRNA synthetase